LIAVPWKSGEYEWILLKCDIFGVPMAKAATSFLGICGVPQLGKNVTRYSANVRQIIAIEEGRVTITDTQTHRKAGIAPNASSK
jgi:hypothetical protein